jgi:uncharacterized protein (TIGR02145 family)
MCKKVTIGGQLWLGENLNIEAADSWCYGNKPDSCAKYGRLYTYDAAKSACELLGGNWHLPSREEWQGLVRAVDPKAELIDGWDYGNVAGKKLKSQNGWYDWDGHNSGNGTDEYGFSALPGGYRNTDGGFDNAGDFGYWWTATENDAGNAYYRGMDDDNDAVNEANDDKGYGCSVRCRGD